MNFFHFLIIILGIELYFLISENEFLILEVHFLKLGIHFLILENKA